MKIISVFKNLHETLSKVRKRMQYLINYIFEQHLLPLTTTKKY